MTKYLQCVSHTVRLLVPGNVKALAVSDTALSSNSSTSVLTFLVKAVSIYSVIRYMNYSWDERPSPTGLAHSRHPIICLVPVLRFSWGSPSFLLLLLSGVHCQQLWLNYLLGTTTVIPEDMGQFSVLPHRPTPRYSVTTGTPLHQKPCFPWI